MNLVKQNKNDYFYPTTSNDLVKYVAVFGVGPEVCSCLWKLLEPRKNMVKGVHITHLLWTLMHLKVYAPDEVLSVIAGVSRKTFKKWVVIFLSAISNLHYDVVSDFYLNFI